MTYPVTHIPIHTIYTTHNSDFAYTPSSTPAIAIAATDIRVDNSISASNLDIISVPISTSVLDSALATQQILSFEKFGKTSSQLLEDKEMPRRRKNPKAPRRLMDFFLLTTKAPPGSILGTTGEETKSLGTVIMDVGDPTMSDPTGPIVGNPSNQSIESSVEQLLDLRENLTPVTVNSSNSSISPALWDAISEPSDPLSKIGVTRHCERDQSEATEFNSDIIIQEDRPSPLLEAPKEGMRCSQPLTK